MPSANSTTTLGFTPDKSTSNSEFGTGTDVLANGTSYTYVKAASAIAAAGTVALTGAFGVTTTTTGSTYTHDVLAPGVAINEFFWARQVTSPI